MRKSMFLLAAAAALGACGIGAPSYPDFADASYRIEGTTADPHGGAATHSVIYRSGPQMRVEATLPEHGPAIVVFDQSTNAAYVLTPVTTPAAAAPATTTAPNTVTTAPNTVTPTAPPAATAAQGAAPAGAPAARPAAPAQIAGIAVRLEDANAPQPMETAWAALGGDNARSTGACEVAGERGHEWSPRQNAPGVERTACITDDGIVLRLRENNLVLWEATSLQRGEQDAALFGVPANYQIVDPGAVAEGVGEQMEQLDSVTGAPPTPQQAPAPRG